MDILYQKLRKINIKLGIVLIAIIVVIFNFSSIKNVIILDINYSKEWNFVALNTWLQKYLPQNTTARVYDISPTQQTHLAFEDKNITLKSWDYTQGPNSLAEFQEEGTQFAILDTATFQLATYMWRTWNDPKKFLKFNNIPFDYIQNSFFGLSIKELMPHTVYELYKPWQAQDLRNYLVFKIPKKSEDPGKSISVFNFDKGEEGFKSVNPFNFSPLVAGWSSMYGKSSLGSLSITSGGDPTQRLVSLPIKIKSGHLYTVKGLLKSELKEESQDRDGFIRMDFYKDEKEAKLGGLGDLVAISPRAYKTGEWVEVQASLIAGKDKNYATISFQRAGFQGGTMYLDDIELFETTVKTKESFPLLPYIRPTIPFESIYYNSFL